MKRCFRCFGLKGRSHWDTAMLIFVLVYLSLPAKTQPEEDGVLFEIKENVFKFDGNSIWQGKANSLLSCSRTCASQSACKRVIFEGSKGTCLLLGEGQTHLANTLVKQDGTFYLKKITSTGVYSLLGTSKSAAIASCQALHSQSQSGVYWIDPDGGSHTNAFRAYCDMKTDGGGWTLVWSYSFTNNVDFTAHSNAVTPRPNWQVTPEVNVPISTTPPLNETNFNAMNFSLWKLLGRQILIKSNINNWLVCHPGTGSLVDWQEGEVSCKVVKHVTNTCTSALAPSKISPSKGYGPKLYRDSEWYSLYYYFDGYTGKDWPSHDPCGTSKSNHLKNVVNPRGNIYIRV